MAYSFSVPVTRVLEKAVKSSSNMSKCSNRRYSLYSIYKNELSCLGIGPKEYEQAIKALANIFEV